MGYPNADQTAGASARRAAPTFGLTPRALKFAQLYAEAKLRGATACAKQAGYARRCRRAAHTRAYELLHDPRVLRAVLYFSAQAINDTRAKAIQQLDRLAATEGRWWNCWDRNAFNRLTTAVRSLESHTQRIENIYAIYRNAFFADTLAIDFTADIWSVPEKSKLSRIHG